MVRLNWKKRRRFKWWANTALWFQCCETWARSLQLHRDSGPGSRYCCHFLGHVSFLNLEGGQLDLFLMKHSSGEEDMLKITTEWKKTTKVNESSGEWVDLHHQKNYPVVVKLSPKVLNREDTYREYLGRPATNKWQNECIHVVMWGSELHVTT